MAELKKYLDKAGLQVLWDQAKAKFIDNAELTTALSNYYTKAEIETELAKYYTKQEIDAFFAEVEAEIAKKVTRSTTLDSGAISYVSNNKGDEGAVLKVDSATHVSAVSSNDGGAGIGAQMYNWRKSGSSYGTGSTIDVTEGGVFYYSGSYAPAATRDVAGNEIAVKDDISEYTIVKDPSSGDYAAVYHLTKDGVNVGDAINIPKDQLLKSVTVKTCTEKDKPISGLNVGDKYLDFEFETTSGTTHSYIAVKDMVKPYTADEDTLTLNSENQFSVKAVPQTKVTGLEASLASKASVTALDDEASAREAADAGKLDLMPGDEHTGGNAYNLPYFFYTVPSTDKVSVHTKTVTLDGTKVHGDYSLDVTSATSSTAGLMSSTDKDKLDNIDTLTQAEIEDICK